MDPITSKLVKTVLQITEAAPTASHPNPLIQAAAEFLHSQLGPLTWRNKETNSPWHYSNRLSMALKDSKTTDLNSIVDAAHNHIIAGHHNIGRWSYENLSPENLGNPDDVDAIDEAGEAKLRERLEDHLHNR